MPNRFSRQNCKARTVYSGDRVGENKSLVCDPGSELRLRTIDRKGQEQEGREENKRDGKKQQQQRERSVYFRTKWYIPKGSIHFGTECYIPNVHTRYQVHFRTLVAYIYPNDPYIFGHSGIA